MARCSRPAPGSMAPRRWAWWGPMTSAGFTRARSSPTATCLKRCALLRKRSAPQWFRRSSPPSRSATSLAVWRRSMRRRWRPSTPARPTRCRSGGPARSRIDRCAAGHGFDATCAFPRRAQRKGPERAPGALIDRFTELSLLAARRELALERQEVEEVEFAAAIEVGPHVAGGEQTLELEEVEEVQHAVAVEIGPARHALGREQLEGVDRGFGHRVVGVVDRAEADAELAGQLDERADIPLFHHPLAAVLDDFD